jgi:hypothetical protein
MTEEWFMLFLLYFLPFLFNVWQRSDWCCCCYIVYLYCLWFDRGVVHVVVVILSTFTVYGLTEDNMNHSSVKSYTVILDIITNNNMNHSSVIHSTVMVDNITTTTWTTPLSYIQLKAWQRSGSCCCCYNVYLYYLMHDRRVVHVVVVILSTSTL